MRVVHVVTLISTDGAYGGPVRVATNITREIGTHEVTAELWGGSKGYPKSTHTLDDVRVCLFYAITLTPNKGFASTMSPRLLISIYRQRKSIDIIHVHLARDFVTLPSALLAKAMRLPYVVQTHGMIVRKNNSFAKIFDWMLVKPALRGASRIFFLTPHEKQQLNQIDPKLCKFTELANGINLSNLGISEGNPGGCEVLFLARMHSRKRPAFFVSSAIELMQRIEKPTFRLVGPDGGEVSKIKDQIADASFSNRLTYEGPLPPSRTNTRIAQCDIYVLPSIDEPFPMSVIEAMALGKPVVVTDTCGLAPYIRKYNAGIVVDATQKALTDAIEKLIQDSRLRINMGKCGLDLVKEEFDISAVSKKVLRVYEEIATEFKE